MSSQGHSRSTSLFRRYLESPRMQRRALSISLAILVVGAAALVFALFRNTGHALPDVASDEPAQIDVQPKTVTISAEALRVARQFILTAVARKNLDAAYDITGPALRGNLTREQWAKGDIPVIYYPADSVPIDGFSIDYSYPKQALMHISLIAKGAPGFEGGKTFSFFIGVKKIGKGAASHWVVNYWAPDYHPPIPGGPQ